MADVSLLLLPKPQMALFLQMVSFAFVAGVEEARTEESVGGRTTPMAWRKASGEHSQ